MKSSYTLSWEVYKAHSEEFKDDYKYYYDFCKGCKTLELFAGYGRLSNHLVRQKIDLETVELEPNFAKFIQLPPERSHVADVLTFKPAYTFDRVIAGYNSFCLFTEEADIRQFFSQLDLFLSPRGMASLNYYHQDYWASAAIYDFMFKGKVVHYRPNFDLSQADKGRGLWVDEYKSDEFEARCEYPTKIYRDRTDFCSFFGHTSLELVAEVREFNEEKVSEPGWIDYVLRKKP